jgi:hypothetical protein
MLYGNFNHGANLLIMQIQNVAPTLFLPKLLFDKHVKNLGNSVLT